MQRPRQGALTVVACSARERRLNVSPWLVRQMGEAGDIAGSARLLSVLIYSANQYPFEVFEVRVCVPAILAEEWLPPCSCLCVVINGLRDRWTGLCRGV